MECVKLTNYVPQAPLTVYRRLLPSYNESNPFAGKRMGIPKKKTERRGALESMKLKHTKRNKAIKRILAAVLLALTNWVKPTKNLHPIVFIAASAVVGVVFRFAGV